ncbi:MAG: hypothetical protein R3E97_11195 [Candidatus Eisenbacteria bacterium]
MRNAALTLLVIATLAGGTGLLSGCGSDGSRLDPPTSTDAGSGPDLSSQIDSSPGELAPPPAGPVHRDGDRFRDLVDGSIYELLDVRRDGWDVTAEVLTSEGFRQVHYEFRLDGERCSHTGEVRADGELLWRQTVEATWDRKLVHVEETDGIDLLRFDVVQGSREDYTFVSGDGGVTHFSTEVGSDDFDGWRSFWPETSLDWNVAGYLCNGIASGRILGEEMEAALRGADSIGDPQYLHPLLEQVCNLLRICTTMKCKAGGNSNQLCLECEAGVMLCDLLIWLGY